jgi:hypothetical protein
MMTDERTVLYENPATCALVDATEASELCRIAIIVIWQAEQERRLHELEHEIAGGDDD